MAEALRTVVIGAGVGGLVAALRLAHQGQQVTVLDSALQPGGKIHTQQVGEALIDSGPTVFTMRWVFDEILRTLGTRLDQHLRLTPLSVLARHFWDDGSQLDLFADSERSEAAIADWAGGDEAQRFRAFCARTRAVYDTLEGPFMRAQRPGLLGLMARTGPAGLAVLSQLGPMRTLWQQMGREFRDPRLRQLFARYATYCGSSPWQAPATLMLVAQVEMDGVWSVEGGMGALAQMLARLAREQGAQLRLGCTAQRIEVQQGQVRGVTLGTGEFLPADQVLFNGEAAALRTGLLGPAARTAVPREAPPRALSAMTWALHAPLTGVALDRHNVFFCPDYAREFEDIFHHQRLPTQPTVYVCAQDRPADLPAGTPERVLALVNAPATGDQPHWRDEDLDACQDTTFRFLHRLGLPLPTDSPGMRRHSPLDFHRRFAASGGALYGQATHGWMGIFKRPGAQTPVRGLYLAGGSVHPGPGVPMAALSGQLAAEAMLANPVSTRRSHPVATFGGMSTP
ncbi:MAG: Hydroxyneurosporene desaturase [Pseudomonadota bacterium]